MKHISRSVLAFALCATLVCIPAIGISGCNESQFAQVINEIGPAVSTILQIVALVKGTAANTALAEKVSADANTIEALYADFEADRSSVAKASLESDINAAFATLKSDLSQIFAVAQVKDANTQAKLTALISLVQTAVQIAESAVPRAALAQRAGISAVQSVNLNAVSLVSSWNKILTAKTGNPLVDDATPKMKLHLHGKFARFATLGFAQ